MIFQNWIPQNLYLEQYGEKVEHIDQRIKKKFWTKGVHYNIPHGCKTRWINTEEVSKWAASTESNTVVLRAAS